MSSIQNYWFISGQVIYRSQKAQDGDVQVLPVNAVHSNNTPYIAVSDINKIQQAMQQQAASRFQDPVEFLDIHIVTINGIGYMTDEQFRDLPEPAAPQEEPKVAEAEDPVATAAEAPAPETPTLKLVENEPEAPKAE